MTWEQLIKEEQTKTYFKYLSNFLLEERQNYTIYPPENEVFNALKYCPYEHVKVVIIGQDPYHGLGQANGLAFSVNDGVNFPPSLRNIFKEVFEDTGEPIPISGNLERWAKQGVLLLNDVLTVREKSPGSHQKKGWELFTDQVIKTLSEEREGIVFMLWGNYAHKKGKNINHTKHLVLQSGHPSPMSANQGKWFGNKHFSKANTYLQDLGKTPIEW